MIVWVTGASSGLGRYTAEAIRDLGHTVVAGARSFNGGELEGIRCLRLDVTDMESIRRFADCAFQEYGRVDAVVHCAAILNLASCEETGADQYSRVMDTDFLGMVRVNEIALPGMRQQGQGRIIMFSSINGLLGVPFQSAYTAAKHAVEGYAECLDMETRAFGIQVCLIEPGDHRGGSGRTRLRHEPETDSPYRGDFERTTSRIAHDEAHGSDPEKLGRKVAHLLEKRHMPLRKRVASADQHLAVFLHDMLPGRLSENILRMYYMGKF